MTANYVTTMLNTTSFTLDIHAYFAPLSNMKLYYSEEKTREVFDYYAYSSADTQPAGAD